MAKAKVAIPAGHITVIDPETRAEIELEVMKCPVTGGMMAVDTEYLEQVGETFSNPYTSTKLSAPSLDEDDIVVRLVEGDVDNPERSEPILINDLSGDALLWAVNVQKAKQLDFDASGMSIADVLNLYPISIETISKMIKDYDMKISNPENRWIASTSFSSEFRDGETMAEAVMRKYLEYAIDDDSDDAYIEDVPVILVSGRFDYSFKS